MKTKAVRYSIMFADGTLTARVDAKGRVKLVARDDDNRATETLTIPAGPDADAAARCMEAGDGFMSVVVAAIRHGRRK